MKKVLLAAFLYCSASLFAGQIQSIQFIRSFTPAQLDSALTANSIPTGIINIDYGVDAYKIIYNTVNPDSTGTIASGLMIVPKSSTCKFPLISYMHGTMTRKSDAPSRMRGNEPLIGLIMGAIGYVAIMPDYLGLGDGPGLHPYQHAHSEATACIDMIRAAREAGDSLSFRLNGQIFLTGYSQGGHACVATHRMIQQQFAGSITVTASAPMSGAYDLSGVMVNLMSSDSVYPEPSYLPYLIYGWKPVYHYFTVDSDVIAHPYDTLMPPLFNGNYSNGYINSRAPQVPKHLFRPEVFDSFVANQNHFFRVALRDNDVYDWKPECPTRILFCGKDTRVPPANSAVLISHFNANGCTQCDTLDVNPQLDHVDCAQYAIFLMKFYFDQYKRVDSCDVVVSGIEEIASSSAISYLKPTQSVRIQTQPGNQINITDLSGRNVLESIAEKGFREFNVEGLTSGIYIVSVSDKNRKLETKKFFKE